MYRKLAAIAAITLALGQTAHAGFSLSGLLDAGQDLAKAAVLSDADATGPRTASTCTGSTGLTSNRSATRTCWNGLRASR